MDLKKGLDMAKNLAEEKGIDLSIDGIKDLIANKAKDGEKSKVESLVSDIVTKAKSGELSGENYGEIKDKILPLIKDTEQEEVRQALAGIAEKFGK